MLSYATWAVAKERPEWDLNPDLCNASAVLNQLSYQANWELLIMWVYAVFSVSLSSAGKAQFLTGIF